MGEFRFLVPAVPLLAIATASGIGSAIETLRGPEHEHPRWWLTVIAGCTVAGLTGAGVLQSSARWKTVKASPQFPFAFTIGQFTRLKAELDALDQRRPLLAYPDMGGQAWVLPNAEIMDSAGLCDRAAAWHANNYPAIDDYFATEGPPLLIDGHGPSGHVAVFAKTLAQMQPHGWGRWMATGVSAQEDPRCPGGKAAVLGLSPEQLLGALRADYERADPLLAIRRWRCAWAYHPEEKLPTWVQLRPLADTAMRRSRELNANGQLEPALRMASLATVLADQNPHYRRWAEQLRERLFPRKG